MEGVTAAAECIRLYFGDQKVVLLSGVMEDKDYLAMADVLAPLVQSVVTVTPDNPRSLPAKRYADVYSGRGISTYAAESIPDGVAQAVSLAKEAGAPLIMLGSLYMYGDVKGITYQRYKIDWVGDQPTLEIKNKYQNTAALEPDEDGILKEVIEYDVTGLATHSQLITDASHTYVKMMANDISESKTLKYFDPNSDIYALVRDNPQGFFTKHDSYEFINSTVKDVYVYDEKTFSGSISFVFTVTRNGKVTEYPFNYTFYFRLVGEKYLIYEMINNGI